MSVYVCLCPLRRKARKRSLASNIARKGRVLQGEQEREHTFVCDRTVRRSKARDFPQDCSPYMTMMPKTKANKATVSTIPQMVR